MGNWYEVLEKISFEYQRIGFVQKRKNGWVAAVNKYTPITGQNGLNCIPLYFATRKKAALLLIEANTNKQDSNNE